MEEVFVIDQILPTHPVTYRIRDFADESVIGSFYEQQLQKTTQTTFRIKRVFLLLLLLLLLLFIYFE